MHSYLPTDTATLPSSHVSDTPSSNINADVSAPGATAEGELPDALSSKDSGWDSIATASATPSIVTLSGCLSSTSDAADAADAADRCRICAANSAREFSDAFLALVASDTHTSSCDFGFSVIAALTRLPALPLYALPRFVAAASSGSTDAVPLRKLTLLLSLGWQPPHVQVQYRQ